MDTVLIAGVDRRLTIDNMSNMSIGQVVDYCIEYNNMHDYDMSGDKPKDTRRKATQADWDALWG